MVYLMKKQEVEKFQAFLENDVFKTKSDYFKQFRGGEQSYDFFMTVGGKDYVVKVLRNGMHRNILREFLAAHIEDVSVLCGVKPDMVFMYGSSYVTVQKNYGNPLPRRKISLTVLYNIFFMYSAFSNLNPPFDKAFDENVFLTRAMKLKEKLSGLRDWKSRLLMKFLQNISMEKLVYDVKKVKLIHGDFFNNQILFKNGRLSAFIDWENVRFGYSTEDYWHFIYYNLQRCLNPFSYVYWRKKLVREISLLAKSSYEEWETALLFNQLHRIENMANRFSLRRLVSFFMLRRLCEQVLAQIKEEIVFADGASNPEVMTLSFQR